MHILFPTRIYLFVSDKLFKFGHKKGASNWVKAFESLTWYTFSGFDDQATEKKVSYVKSNNDRNNEQHDWCTWTLSRMVMK